MGIVFEATQLWMLAGCANMGIVLEATQFWMLAGCAKSCISACLEAKQCGRILKSRPTPHPPHAGTKYAVQATPSL